MIFERADVIVSVVWGIGLQVLMATGVYAFAGHTPTVLQTETEIAIPVAIAPAMPIARGAKLGAVKAAANAPAPAHRPEEPKSTDVNPLASAKPVVDAGVAPQASAAGPSGSATSVSTNAAEPVGPVASATASSGGDGDPLAAQQAGMYRGQLDAWFSVRFQIRGKLPYDQLKNLRATAVVSVDASRQVTGFQIVKPSGDPIFDAELRRALSAAQSSGSTLPAPPESHPELLGTQVTLSFSCTSRARCE
jgi:outer membrane biosynthesis protein TonB